MMSSIASNPVMLNKQFSINSNIDSKYIKQYEDAPESQAGRF